MGWHRESWASCGWGNHVPQTAKAVAEAFYAGKSRKRGNCRTDGWVYWLFGNAIARRVPEQDIPTVITRALERGQLPPPKLEFSWAGWPTRTTCRHLNALGVKAEIEGLKDPILYFQGKRLPPGSEKKWWTPAEIDALVSYEPPPPDPRPRGWKTKERFENMTMDLFAEE